MVTSALPGEGKTFTAINLAISIAMEFDNTVLLVDGDVAHPALPDVLGVPTSPGLLDLLTRDDLDVADALVQDQHREAHAPSGRLAPPARDRAAGERTDGEPAARARVARIPDRIIIFDSPPLLATTEARVLATHMGQIVMVVAADSTRSTRSTRRSRPSRAATSC